MAKEGVKRRKGERNKSIEEKRGKAKRRREKGKKKEKCNCEKNKNRGGGDEWSNREPMERVEDRSESGRSKGDRKRSGGGTKKMALVRLEDMKGKMEVMRKKVALRGRLERIEDD